MRKSRQTQQKQLKISSKEGYTHEQYAISPDDKYLAIGLKLVQFGILVHKSTEVQILDFEDQNIIQTIRLPNKQIKQTIISSLILRFSKDSSKLYVCDRDNIFQISTKRKQIRKFKAIYIPILNILELKNNLLAYSTNNKLYIIRERKIIKTMTVKANSILSFDQHDDLLLIHQCHQILIISIYTLKILYIHQIFCLDNALFLQNKILTLNKKNDLKIWEIDKQSLILTEKFYQSLFFRNFENVLKLEINTQLNYIILYDYTEIFILDSNLQLNEVVKIIAPNGHCERYLQNSQTRVYYFDCQKQIIYILPIVQQ